MPGRDHAPKTGRELEDKVVRIATALGLDAATQVYLGRRVWGAERRVDVLLTDPRTRTRLGIECKFQGTSGTAEEKIPSLLRDIDAWPIRGIVVIEGTGFSENMRGYLLSSGKVVETDDLDVWLRLYFGLELPEDASARRRRPHA